MKALLSAVLVSTGLVAIVGSVSLDEFKCGTNKVTTAFTFRSVKASCPKHMDEINECCHEHDECYNDQLGRGHCDKTFCGCLNHVVESYDANCDSIFKNMCRAVKLLGGSAYKRSKGKVLNGVREKRSGEGLNETFTLEVESTTEVATVRHVVEGTTAFPKETAVVPGEVPKEVRRHPSSLEKQSNREAELATLYEYWTSYTQIESLGIQCPRWHLAFLMMCLMTLAVALWYLCSQGEDPQDGIEFAVEPPVRPRVVPLPEPSRPKPEELGDDTVSHVSSVFN